MTGSLLLTGKLGPLNTLPIFEKLRVKADANCRSIATYVFPLYAKLIKSMQLLAKITNALANNYLVFACSLIGW